MSRRLSASRGKGNLVSLGSLQEFVLLWLQLGCYNNVLACFSFGYYEVLAWWLPLGGIGFMATTTRGLQLGYKASSCFGFGLATTIMLWLDGCYWKALTWWVPLVEGLSLATRLCLVSALAWLLLYALAHWLLWGFGWDMFGIGYLWLDGLDNL